MAIITKPNTFSAGATIVASEHNSNFDTIYNDYNGNITNANLAAGAAIADTKLAQITTYAKVSGTALVSLASVASAAGYLPIANGGLGADLSTASVGAIPYFAQVGTMTALASGASGLFLMSTNTTAAPVFARPASIGTRVDKSSSYGATLADTDGFITAFATSGTTAFDVQGITDANSNPTTIVARQYWASPNTGTIFCVTFPVKKGDYWKIVVTNQTAITVYWTPIGS